MATNDNGSDLDVFEGLSKKSPSPSSSPSAADSIAPPPPPRGAEVTSRTLLGLTSPGPLPAAPELPPPASSPFALSNASRPLPPPPGRTALPPVTPAPDTLEPAAASPAGARPAIAVDWDDEDEATQIFDKSDDIPIRSAGPAPAAGMPHPQLALKTTLLGLTPPPDVYQLAGNRVTPPPPAPGSVFLRGSPPPPGPGSLPPPALGTLPPPPATLQGLGGSTQARSMPPPPGAMSPIYGASGSTIPPNRMLGSDAFPARATAPNTEVTALLRPPQGRAAVWVGMAFVAALIVGAFLFVMPHTGRVVINVTDPRGSTVGRVDIFVDGRKQCDTAPCIVEQLSAGSHEVKILADGYDAPSAQEVVIEARRDATASFTLGAPSKGTGLKLGGTQPGVKLYLDEREVGALPQELRDVPPGDHVVKIVGSERYQPLERRVSIAKDVMEDLGSVTLKVLKGKATISLATPGARVFLVSGTDRRELPMLPISVDIDTTKGWALQASRAGYADYTQSISFDDGQAEKTYVVSLEPRATGNAGGYGGGTQGGGWSPPANQAPSPPSPPAVQQPMPAALPERAAPPAASPVQAAAPANAGGGAVAAGGEGFLNINSIPPSTCFVDGKQLGATPRVHVSVTPGAHQVKFVNAEQQLTKTISVTVGAGETKMAVAKLNN